jgi:2-oxoglutarate dehydrogenase E2 component (dihydrolipoamide succinyltransferase)
VEILVPELGESIVEATVARWLKNEGDAVSFGEPLVQLETDKVDLEVGAKEDGVLAKINHSEGEDVRVGDVLGSIETKENLAEQPQPSGDGSQEEYEHEQTQQPVQREAVAESKPGPLNGPSGHQLSGRMTPVARRMAEAAGLDLKDIREKETGERITKQDIEKLLTKEQATREPATPTQKTAPTVQPAQEQSRDQRIERIRLSRRRRTIAERLLEAQRTAAILTTFNDVDMSAVIDIRKRRREQFIERHGVKLGFMSFFVKAVIGGLKEFPWLNAEIQGDELLVKHFYDIGIAVGVEEGLVVPVLRDADRQSFAEIEKKIGEFSEKARTNTLSLDDLRGGTFSITNGGVFGSLLSTPILNPPQVAILGLHRIEDRPVAENGRAVVRPMMYMALSYDHRIVDGRQAVQFLVRIKELIQDPEKLLLEG